MLGVPKGIWACFIVELVTGLLGLITTFMIGNVSDIANQNTNTLRVLNDDWTVTPFVSVSTTDNKCPAGTDSVFVRPWGGVRDGCYVPERI